MEQGKAVSLRQMLCDSGEWRHQFTLASIEEPEKAPDIFLLPLFCHSDTMIIKLGNSSDPKTKGLPIRSPPLCDMQKGQPMSGISCKYVQGPAEDRSVDVEGNGIIFPFLVSVFSQFNMPKCEGYCVKIPYSQLCFGIWSDHRGFYLEAVTVARNSNFKAVQIYKTGQTSLPISKISAITESSFSLYIWNATHLPFLQSIKNKEWCATCLFGVAFLFASWDLFLELAEELSDSFLHRIILIIFRLFVNTVVWGSGFRVFSLPLDGVATPVSGPDNLLVVHWEMVPESGLWNPQEKPLFRTLGSLGITIWLSQTKFYHCRESMILATLLRKAFNWGLFQF